MAAYEADTKPSSKKDKEKLIAKVKKCFKAACDAEDKQRIREQEDLAFQDPDNQWDAEAKVYRRGSATAPGRPMLSVSLLSQPMALIQNQAVAAKLGVEIHPVSEKANKDTAEVKQGLYRRIERDSNAQDGRLWGLDRAKQCGRGYYRVNTQWDEDGDDEFDQEIVIERIQNQENVYFDPSSQKPDLSDAKWAMVVTWLTREDFEEQFPDAEVPSGDAEFKSWHSEAPEWVKPDLDAVLVAEYLYKVPVKRTLERKVGKKTLSRQKEETKVKRAVVTCREVLEEADWNGHYIPIVPVIGTMLQPYDGERRWEGMVRKARGAQKIANFAISTVIEVMAQEPKSPWVGAEGQFRGHEDEWQLANVRNQPYLEYRPVSHEGTQAPPPQRVQADTSKLGMALNVYQQARDLVQSATAVYAPSLGEAPTSRDAQSGRAIVALQQQSDAGTSHFLQNLANISMPYEARVVLDLMESIYDRPGRVVQILGGEDDERAVMLGRPYVEHEGSPVPVDEMQQAGVQVPPGAKVKEYNLAGGKYSISVSIGKSFQTRLQEGASEIGAVLQAAPQLMPLIGPTYFRYRDFPGAKDIADLLKKVREKEYPGLDGEEGQEPSPEQLKGELQKMGEAMKQMEAQFKGAVQQIETDQAKQQAQMMKAQLDAQTKMHAAELDAQTKREIAAADNATKLEIASLGARVDEMLTILKVQGEAYKIEAQAAHDDRQAAQGREHEAVMGELGREAPEKPEPKGEAE